MCVWLFKLQLQGNCQLLNLEFSPGVASWHPLQEGFTGSGATRTTASFILNVDQH